MICKPPMIAIDGNWSMEGAEPEQSLWFSVSFDITRSIAHLTVRRFADPTAHVVAVIPAGKLLIDSK
jgi:hypothetical protein